ncbi:hypothetical protein [Pelagicoccus sp. SDUM812002]|uniref:hypothetical protein n=1 Tax=Pelagicoccus sp. SDUM812002 TaxID=3041266 RepID=UPI0028103BDB|nr:hypothetical protein [Pelagicoccus sp. SDUM812002]MDQ8186714.1 hypothetical protein [Pelagicoccus sp. SDUM812002]
MPADAELKPDPIPITPWKKAMLLAVALLFGGTLFEYYRGGINEAGGWLWPMLFIPLILYLLGIVYGDVPARYYDLKILKPFPVPFARQFDRCVLAIIVLFTGLFLNMVLLAVSALIGAKLMLTVFYLLYMVLMLAELPNSLRIFRFIQHVNTVQYVSAIHPNTFKKAIAYYSPEQDKLGGEELIEHLGTLYKSLVAEAEELVVSASPLTREQQIALNLAVRAGEAIRRTRIADQSHECERLRANIFLLEALEANAGLEIPRDVRVLRNKIKGIAA